MSSSRADKQSGELSHRKPKPGGGSDNAPASSKKNKVEKSNRNNQKKTEAELDDEFEAQCEKWCGVVFRIGFAAYSMFGIVTSTYEWGMRPSMLPLDPSLDLTGTNVVLTGGCSGIGLETTFMLASRGARVIVGCRPPPPPEPSAEAKKAAAAAAKKTAAAKGRSKNKDADDDEGFEPPASNANLQPPEENNVLIDGRALHCCSFSSTSA